MAASSSFRSAGLRVEVLHISDRIKTIDGSRYEVCVAVGQDGYIGLGFKSSNVEKDAESRAKTAAKCGLVPIERGAWRQNETKPHTVSRRVTAKHNEVSIRLTHGRRNTGIVCKSAEIQTMLELAGIKDCYVSITGPTDNKTDLLKATFAALIDNK
ncbi:hypothetical protein PV327_001493 [Microctonus hyperodae]|uniref:Small ribosomal subunit protein uS5 C-terminal domain-containing protein n=1 Tax=Microctonus hyperodae TaxID=165561 RepID=A0AA39G8B8_MICHY|nr:hypothetical protein PV327_001493 [Microctonus hyperodae]